MKLRFLFLYVGLLLSCALARSAVAGTTYRLDDSASQVVPPVGDMRWNLTASLQGNAAVAETDFRVFVHLDTKAYINRSGRIYMVLAKAGSDPGVAVRWTTSGRLSGGSLVPGIRTLVYSGIITQPTIDDEFQVNLRASGLTANGPRRFNFYFEFDTD